VLNVATINDLLNCHTGHRVSVDVPCYVMTMSTIQRKPIYIVSCALIVI